MFCNFLGKPKGDRHEILWQSAIDHNKPHKKIGIVSKSLDMEFVQKIHFWLGLEAWEVSKEA